MRKTSCMLLAVLIICMSAIFGQGAMATSEYFSSREAVTFLSFVYNASTEKVTSSTLADDIYYRMLTGQYADNPTYELAAKAAFLSFLDARLAETLAKVNQAVRSSSDYLITYLTEEAESEAVGLVSGIFKDNLGKSLINLCGDDGDVLDLADDLKDASENPSQYLDKVKAISSAFTYLYGQNVASLYTYFDAALSNVYLKSTPGAYETAMSYNIMALRESNFMAFAAKLIPGITSWEEWVSEMDVWAEYVSDLRSQVVAGKTGKSYVVVFHPNCEGMDIKVNWYASGELKGPKMEREDYIFQGWYFDEACTDGPVPDGYVVTENLVLYAKWEPRYFQITFDSNCDEVADYSYLLDRLNDNWHEPNMTRPGYLFRGWYWDAACTNPVEGSFTVDRDMTFYAGWKLLYTYSETDGKATLLYYNGKWETDENGQAITDVVIPSTAGGYPVAFVDVDGWNLVISGITFPDTVEKILEWSFSYCRKLTKVIMGNGIIEIEEGAFNLCDKLETVVFSNSLQTIGYEAFVSCSALSEIKLPESLKTIDKYAFSGCGISELKLPDSVETVADYAFRGCKQLKTVTIGKNTSVLSGASFEGCNNLEAFTVSNENLYFTTEDGVLYNKDKTILYKYPAAKTATTFTVPSTVTTIATNAFSGCTSLREITMGDHVKTIGESAFEGCVLLERVTLPSALTAIAKKTFYGCGKLAEIAIPAGVKTIGSSAFYECASLREISLPVGLTLIDWDAFYGCGLTQLVIPDSVTTIGEFAFYGCKELCEVRLPSGITRLETLTFGDCISLQRITVPETVTNLGYSVFSGCTSLSEVRLPKSVTWFGGGIFTNCTALESVRIPDGVTDIYYDTFYGCTALKNLILPGSITYIEGGNFTEDMRGCSIYYEGTRDSWDKVEIYEYGNEGFSEMTIYYNCPVMAEFGEVLVQNGTLSGTVCYDRLTEDCEVFVGLYQGDRFIAADVGSVSSGEQESSFSVSVTPGQSYCLKVMFWNPTTLSPKRGTLQKTILQTN